MPRTVSPSPVPVQVRYLIRDRDGEFPALFHVVLADAGIDVIVTGVWMPRMNAAAERWVRSCRSESLDRTLIWNQAHLLHALRGFETYNNTRWPHWTLRQSAPLHPAPEPITAQARIIHLDIPGHDRLGGTRHAYERPA